MPWFLGSIEISLKPGLRIHLVVPGQNGRIGRREGRGRLRGGVVQRALKRALAFAGLLEIEVAAGEAPLFHVAKFPPIE